MNSERRFEPEKLGLGLCEGYDKMGHELSKPYLRAELENQLKAYVFSKILNEYFCFLGFVKDELIQRVRWKLFFLF